MTGIQLLLNVPFAQKDKAQAQGARWSAEKRAWYVPYGVDINRFHRWWPRDLKAQMRSMGKKCSARCLK